MPGFGFKMPPTEGGYNAREVCEVAIVVQKYGGSSVADVERIGIVADRVAATKASGRDVVVVVSAMGDTTDELLALARQVSREPLPARAGHAPLRRASGSRWRCSRWPSTSATSPR